MRTGPHKRGVYGGDCPQSVRSTSIPRSKAGSHSIHLIFASGRKMATLDFGRLVWAADAQEGYVLGTLTDIGNSSLTVERKDNKQPMTVGYEEVFPAEEDGKKTVDDNCQLMYLNEGTLLNNCRLRYHQRKIYSYVANILVSINPYENIDGLYSDTTIHGYRGKSLGQMPPHIYAIADKAYRDMRRLKESQSIVVSGESGAGKTESQKAVLRYLCENWGSGAGPIQQRILQTGPILEAFGNAKTLRNNNSSRFGKFVEIHFGPNGQVVGGYVSHYLLEKSRLCRQAEGERTYHIFYQLIAGADHEMYRRLQLAPPDRFNYLRHGCAQFFGGSTKIDPSRLSANGSLLHDPIVDDARDFHKLVDAFQTAGLSMNQVNFIWNTVAALLHLGNINFEENVDDNRGGCCIAKAAQPALNTAATLLGLEPQELQMGLVAKIMQATKGGVKGTLIRVPLKTHEAAAGRDALAKAIYSRLFDWLVQAINRSINQTADGKIGGGSTYIGVLDIAGFEFFTVNSFEQFCINYCNEKLQNFFNERILNQEQELYEKEGLQVPRIDYSDNNDCIELFEKKGTGLLDMLDEEAKLPRATAQHYTTAAMDANKGHFRLETPRKSKLRAHRDMRDDEGFLVRHYAGTVCYQTNQFLEKNNDQLHNSLEILIEQSSIALLRGLFEQAAVDVAPTKRPSTKLQSASVGNKFRGQLGVLIEKLTTTGTHFVRCVKPNGKMAAGELDAPAVLSQLRCAGMGSVLRLMQKGYPSRTPFAELYTMYKTILPQQLAHLDPRLFCKCLFRALGLDTTDFKFGHTKVFFRPGKFAEFDQMLRTDPEHMQSLVAKVSSWLRVTRWKKAIYGVWSVIKLKNKILYRQQQIIRIQSLVRGYLTRRQTRPRLELFRRILNLLERSTEMTEIVKNMEPASAAKWTGPVSSSFEGLEQLVKQLKTGDVDLEKAVLNYEDCVKKVDEVIERLKQQVHSDEQEKIRELERKRRDEEDRKKKSREEEVRLEKEKAQRKVMEEQREREARQWRESLERQVAEDLRQKQAEEQKRARAEQERLDAALSVRLDKQGLVDTPSTSISSASSNGSVTTSKGKYNLSDWKYADLRDTINTSNDMELLVACKEEFHRRLRVYNVWKERNAASRDLAPQRAPLAVYNSAKSTAAPARAAPHVNPALTLSRYFKVPFARPADVYKTVDGLFESGGQTGVWYAHFYGQWVQRQIELHPDKKPMLLTAGHDDLQMCEIPLDQTGLTRKKGAEIQESEFETVWAHLGGAPPKRWSP